MSWLIVPVTVILLRGAFAVLLLAGAESIGGDYLSARVRRALWIICIILMMIPQPHFPFQLFAIDFTDYHRQMINAASILPREIAGLVGNIEFFRAARDYSFSVTGLAYQNYPYLLGMILMTVPALFLLLGSYLRCRRQTKLFKAVRDERLLKIWAQVHGGAKGLPLLLDSGAEPHPPVLFGFFRQKLLLPVEHLKKLTDSEVELLLTHEYIHYRSMDGIINIFTLCLWPFCWYNPFFLAARRRLRINCELTCDAEVLKRFPERTAEYGRLLLSFAGTSRPPEVTLAFREYAGELRSRIIYMTQLPDRRKSSLCAVLFLVFLLGAPFGLFSTVIREKEPKRSFLEAELITGEKITEKSPLRWRLKIKGVKAAFLLTVRSGKEELHIPVTSPPRRLQLVRDNGKLYLELLCSTGNLSRSFLPADADAPLDPVRQLRLYRQDQKGKKLFSAGEKEIFLFFRK